MQLSDKTRKLLFLFACIPIRILMVLLAKYLPKQYLYYYGIGLLSPAAGFLYLYFFNLRLNAPEGGGKTWWAPFRIFHGLLYLAAAILAIRRLSNIAWIPLAIDVTMGFLLFMGAKPP